MWTEEEVEALRRARDSDPDPRVRRRAHALLLLAEGQPVIRVARLLNTAPRRIRAWRTRFLAAGSDGLNDRARTGRPPKLKAGELTFLEEALAKGPKAYDLPDAAWTVQDLCQVLTQRRGVQASRTTVYRALRQLGYQYLRSGKTIVRAEARAGGTNSPGWLKQ